MADAKAESNVRKIIDDAKNNHEKFTFENKSYEIIENHKPSRETKTDFYLIARGLDDGKEREFKISYKKLSFSFVENKIKPKRIPFIYGNNWSHILQEQVRPMEDMFKAEYMIDFKLEKIKLGWRYEIEQLDAPGIGPRKLSTTIKQNIASQVLWGDGCVDERKDADVNGKQVANSGIPDFILIKDPDDVNSIQDVFDDLQDIKKYARNHSKMRASFLGQNFRWKSQTNEWKTEGYRRNFAVWVDWKVDKNGKLDGRLVFDDPLKESGDVLKNLKGCLEKMGIPNDQKFRLEMLQGRVSDNTPVKQ